MVVGHRISPGEQAETNRPALSSTDYSLAGLLTGLATRVLVQPLDVVKIRFQLQEEPMRGVNAGKYRGFLQAITLIAKEEGIGSLWKGHIPAQGLSAVYGLVQFSTFEYLSTRLDARSQKAKSMRSVIDLISGAIAGCCGITAAMPFDVIRSRLVAQSGHEIYTGTMHAVRAIARTDGFKGFFRGLTPSLAQIAPYTGIQFATYNWCSALLSQVLPHNESSRAFVCGAVAGTLAKACVYPFDVIRHRLQMQGFQRVGFGKASQYNGMLSAFAQAIRNESLIGLFKGLYPSMLKAAASSGLSFLFYDLFCKFLRRNKT